MIIKNIAGFRNIQEFVNYKIQLLRNSDKSMKSLYELMFSERENVMFEESNGFKIVKTTYGEVKALADKICGNIHKKINAGNGAVIGLYMDNSPLMIAVFWAILKAGFCPLLINMRLSDSVIENTITSLKVAAVISDGKKFSTNTILAKDLQNEENDKIGYVFGREFYVMSSGSVSLKICAYTAENIFCIIESHLKRLSAIRWPFFLGFICDFAFSIALFFECRSFVLATF